MVDQGDVVGVEVVDVELGLLLRLGVVVRVVAGGLVVTRVGLRLSLVLDLGLLVDDGDAVVVEGGVQILGDLGRGDVAEGSGVTGLDAGGPV